MLNSVCPGFGLFFGLLTCALVSKHHHESHGLFIVDFTLTNSFVQAFCIATLVYSNVTRLHGVLYIYIYIIDVYIYIYIYE